MVKGTRESNGLMLMLMFKNFGGLEPESTWMVVDRMLRPGVSMTDMTCDIMFWALFYFFILIFHFQLYFILFYYFLPFSEFGLVDPRNEK